MAFSSQYVPNVALGNQQAGHSRVKHIHLSDISIWVAPIHDISIRAVLIHLLAIADFNELGPGVRWKSSSDPSWINTWIQLSVKLYEDFKRLHKYLKNVKL